MPYFLTQWDDYQMWKGHLSTLVHNHLPPKNCIRNRSAFTLETFDTPYFLHLAWIKALNLSKHGCKPYTHPSKVFFPSILLMDYFIRMKSNNSLTLQYWGRYKIQLTTFLFNSIFSKQIHPRFRSIVFGYTIKIGNTI